MGNEIRIGVLGAGGLGRNAARLISMKKGVRLIALCDRKGFAFEPSGIAAEVLDTLTRYSPQDSSKMGQC